MTELFTLSRELGFTAAAPVNMSALTPLEEVRAMCEADRCGQVRQKLGMPAWLRDSRAYESAHRDVLGGHPRAEHGGACG